MIKYVFLTIVAALALTSLTYGGVESNHGALNAIYFDDSEGVVTYSLSQDPELSILIKTLNGESIKINLSRDTFVYEIKELMEEVLGIPFDKQRLVFSGKVLQDDYTLNDYDNLHDGSSVHLVRLLY